MNYQSKWWRRRRRRKKKWSIESKANQEKKEEDEIWVLDFEKEEDDNRDQFEFFIIFKGLTYPLICWQVWEGGR